MPRLDRTLIEGGCWETASFTVPAGVPHERVLFLADRYQRRFGNWLEKAGFQVLHMTQPVVYLGRLPVEGGRRKYRIFAWCRRRPRELHNDIPDILVPEMLERGLVLKE